MHLLWTLLIGLVIGAVAKFLMPGKDPGGFIVTMLIGIAGSFVATYIGQALGLVSRRPKRRFHHVGAGRNRALRHLSPDPPQNSVIM